MGKPSLHFWDTAMWLKKELDPVSYASDILWQSGDTGSDILHYHWERIKIISGLALMVPNTKICHIEALTYYQLIFFCFKKMFRSQGI